MPRVKVSESLFTPLGGQQTQFPPASNQPVVLQNMHRLDALPGVIWRKGLMKAEYSLDLRLMKGKDMYKGEEARVPIQTQAESYQRRRWRITTPVRLSSPVGAPDPNTPLYIKVWGCWQCSQGPMKKAFSGQICSVPRCLPMRKECLLWDCFHCKVPNLCATQLRPSKFVQDTLGHRVTQNTCDHAMTAPCGPPGSLFCLWYAASLPSLQL